MLAINRVMITALLVFTAFSGSLWAQEVIDPSEVPVFSGEPEDIGCAYGRMYGQDMRLLADVWLTYHTRLASLTGPGAVIRARNNMARHLPDSIYREMQAIADNSPMLPREVWHATFASDILQMALRPLGCSTYTVMPSRSATGSMIYGRNLDYFRSQILREHWQPMVFARNGTKKILTIGVKGQSGVMTAINESGVMMSILVSFSQERYTARGVSSLSIMRLVLEQAESAAHAVNLYTQYSRTVPVNISIADGQEAYVLEAGVNYHAVREPNAGGVVYAANHFETPWMTHPRHGRDERWPTLQRYDHTSEPITKAQVRDILGRAAELNPGFIAENILAVLVDFGEGTIAFGGDEPVAIEGHMKVLNYRDLFSSLAEAENNVRH